MTAPDSEATPPQAAPARKGPPDLTQGPIGRTLLMFAVPTLASNILQSLNGSVNAIWVGRFLGEGALAATSNANIIMFLLFSTVFGFGMAATVMIGQAMGRRDVDGARRALGSSLGFCVTLAIIVSAAGWIAAPQILHALSTPPQAYQLALDYLRVIFLSMPPSLITVTIVMGLRGTGDAMTPMWFMILTIVLDATLNPILILGVGPAPQMGIAGSATATLIANLIGLVSLITYIYRKDMPMRLRGAELRYLIPDPALLKIILTKGFPMGLQMIVMSSAGLIMVGLVNREGFITAAAYGASQQVWTYLQMPAMAIGAAVSAMAAQNIGAGKWDRVGKVNLAGLIFALLFTGTMIALILAFDRPVLALFLGSGSAAIDVARHMQFLASWSFLFFALTMCYFSTMRANGVVVAPLLILTFTLFGVRLGFYYLAYPRFGADALWLAFPVGSITSLTLAAIVYYRGGWKKARMMPPPTVAECEESVLSEAEPTGRMQPAG